MNKDLLSSVEKNIELQAAGLLTLTREEFAFAEARGEIAKQKLADRLRACLGFTLELQVATLGWLKIKVVQVSNDHLVASTESNSYLIRFSSLVAVRGLTKSNKTPNKIDNSWRLNSSLRQWMIDKATVIIYLKGEATYTGQIKKIFQDHFELSTDIGVLVFSESALLIAVKVG